MNNYIPFLKFKINEIGGLKALSTIIKGKTIPFFDLPKNKTMVEQDFLGMLEKCARSIKKNLVGIPAFFLDNFDIDDELTVAGQDNYEAVIDVVGMFSQFIPVVALDRPPQRNDIVFAKKDNGKIISNTISIRLQPDDFQSFAVIEDELVELHQRCLHSFKKVILILDNRLCQNIDIKGRAKLINNFLQKSNEIIEFSAVIIAGSSIPASARDMLAVESEVDIDRIEIQIYRIVAVEKHHPKIYLGDYTVVSPNYSELDIPAEAMQNVVAAKTIYTHGDSHYIARGGSLKHHARGRLQYNDIAITITHKPFYRGKAYSFGDNYIDEKANNIGSGVGPGSILKPTINLHITYMLTSFPG